MAQLFTVHLHDELPGLGSGRRILRLHRRGWRWVLVSNPVKGRLWRIHRDVWEKIAVGPAREKRRQRSTRMLMRMQRARPASMGARA